jgi:hypothetical protein
MNRLLRIAPMPAVAVLLVSGAVATPGRAQTVVNDNDPSIIYSLSANATTPTSDWSYYSGIPRDYDGNEHSSNFSRPGPAYQGASVSITFTGTTITWYGKKGPRYGYAIASLETGAFVEFNGYNATEIDQNANVTLSAPYGYHVLTIRLLHQTQGSDHYQTVDYFAITGGGPVTLSQGEVAGYSQWNSGALAFHSLEGRCPFSNAANWNCYGYLASDLSGGHFWDGNVNDTISYRFTGSLIEIYGRPDAENGYFKVSIDGTNYGTYDENFGIIDDDSLNAVMIFAAQVSNGEHTITVTVAGRNNGSYSKSRNLVQIDEFVSFGSSTGGRCQYELPPQRVGQQPVSFSMMTETGASPPALFWDARSNTQLQRYQKADIASDPYQDFTWTSVSPGFKVCTEGGSNLCLSAANGILKLSTTHDVFQVLGNAAILDVNSCSFIQNPQGVTNGTSLTLGSTQSPWVFSSPH